MKTVDIQGMTFVARHILAVGKTRITEKLVRPGEYKAKYAFSIHTTRDEDEWQFTFELEIEAKQARALVIKAIEEE